MKITSLTQPSESQTSVTLSQPLPSNLQVKGSPGNSLFYSNVKQTAMTHNQITRISLKTLAIKARVYNYIRQTLYKKRLEDFTDQQKIEFFNEVWMQNRAAHRELHNYKIKRQRKAEIERLRQQRRAAQTS
jgi:hypothetical protein